MDGRVSPWFRVNAEIVTEATGSRLLDEYGVEGLGAWVALNAKAKQSANEGMVSFRSDTDLWTHLGIPDPGFGAEEFLRLLGRLHETRTKRRARVTTITLTRWDELQVRRGRRTHDASTTHPRRIDDEQNPRSAQELRTQDKDKDKDNDNDNDTASPGMAIAIKEAERQKANGTLIDGEPIRSAVALGVSWYNQRPGYWDDLARTSAVAEAIDETTQEIVSELSQAFSMDETEPMPEPDDEHEGAL